MLILAFDTSVAACSAALWRDGALLAKARQSMDQGQGEALLPMIEDVMSEAGVNYAGLDRIAVTVGPGSFTGVRVGLAAARGLGLAADKPVIGVKTTEVLAAAIPDAERTEAGESAHLLAVIDTKRGDLYVQAYDHKMHEVVGACVMAVADLAVWNQPHSVLVVGDAAAIAVAAIGPRASLSSADAVPDPAVLARLAAQRQPKVGGPLPVYVRAPDATMPQYGGRLRP